MKPNMRGASSAKQLPVRKRHSLSEICGGDRTFAAFDKKLFKAQTQLWHLGKALNSLTIFAVSRRTPTSGYRSSQNDRPGKFRRPTFLNHLATHHLKLYGGKCEKNLRRICLSIRGVIGRVSVRLLNNERKLEVFEGVRLQRFKSGARDSG